MNALVLNEGDTYPTLQEFPTPVLKDDEALIKVECAALNHRDIWICEGKYPGLRYPVIMGSDGAGWLGNQKVVIQPGQHWGESEKFQSKQYHILGTPSHGTFAEYVAVGQSQVFPMPGHLDFTQAAALPLAGLTAYRVLSKRCGGKAGEKLLITGIGGGVAVTCLQFALAIGMEVYVTSGSDAKIEKAIGLGAKGGANYNNKDWPTQLLGLAGAGMDVIIDSAGGDSFQHLVKLCAPGGRIGMYGGTMGTINNLSPQLIFWRQISIHGSTMGSNGDFSEMLAFVNQHQIVPIIDSVFKKEEAHKAFKKMAEGKQFGKIVLKMA